MIEEGGTIGQLRAKSMNQRKIKIENQEKISKWIFAILLLVILPPLGVCYIWRERCFFSSKIPLFLLFFGVLTFVISLISLTTWWPSMESKLQEAGLNIPSYPVVILAVVSVFSVVQIISSFIIDKKRSISQGISKKVLAVGLAFLAINLTLIPLLFIIIRWTVSQQLYRTLIS